MEWVAGVGRASEQGGGGAERPPPGPRDRAPPSASWTWRRRTWRRRGRRSRSSRRRTRSSRGCSRSCATSSRNPLHFDGIEGRGNFLTHSKIHCGLPKTPVRYTTNYLKLSKTLCISYFYCGLQYIWVTGLGGRPARTPCCARATRPSRGTRAGPRRRPGGARRTSGKRPGSLCCI